MLKINEIFYSLQGEGANTGMPVIFIRFAGCNLKCSWCDTRHQSFKELDEVTIIKYLQLFLPCKRIIFTGGEPTLQNYNLLVKSLNKLGYWLGIETNGTSNRKKLENFDWVTISPKNKDIKLEYCDELKVVWTGKEDLKWFEGITAKHYFLQPCSMKNIPATIRKVKMNPKWRLSLQCQKLLNIK